MDAKGVVITEGSILLGVERAMEIVNLPAPLSGCLWKICWESAAGAGVNSYLTGQPPYALSAYVEQALGLLQPEGFTSLEELSF